MSLRHTGVFVSFVMEWSDYFGFCFTDTELKAAVGLAPVLHPCISRINCNRHCFTPVLHVFAYLAFGLGHMYVLE